jgi:hypothetical protein
VLIETLRQPSPRALARMRAEAPTWDTPWWLPWVVLGALGSIIGGVGAAALILALT